MITLAYIKLSQKGDIPAGKNANLQCANSTNVQNRIRSYASTINKFFIYQFVMLILMDLYWYSSGNIFPVNDLLVKVMVLAQLMLLFIWHC